MPRELLHRPPHIRPGSDRRLADQLLCIEDEARLLQLLDALRHSLDRKAGRALPGALRLPGESVAEARHRRDQMERIAQDRRFLAHRVTRLQAEVRAGGSLALVQQEAAAIARRDREPDALAAALASRPDPELQA